MNFYSNNIGGVMKLVSLMIIAGFFIISCSEDDTPTESGGTNLSGTVLVKATQQPLSGAQVSLGKELTTTTDASGNYVLANVPTVKQDFKVAKEGYAVYIEEFTPVKGENTFDVEMETHVEFCNRVTSVVYRTKTYNTVLVGGQCWFKENLNAGTRISWGGDWENGEELPNNTVLEKWCVSNQESNCDRWGGLYSWNEAMNWIPAHSNQGICPDGWRLPTIAEFEELAAFANDNVDALMAEDDGGTNETGWSAVDASTHFMENAGAGPVVYGGPRWWSTTEENDNRSNNFALWGENIVFEDNYKFLGFSVRCLKD